MASRIESAKRRSAGAKRVLVGLVAASFVVAGVLARATHPGHHTARAGTPSTSSGSTAGTSSESESSDDGFSLAPSNGAQAQVQTGVS